MKRLSTDTQMAIVIWLSVLVLAIFAVAAPQTLTLSFGQAQARAEQVYPGKAMTAEVRHSGTKLVDRWIGLDSGFGTMIMTGHSLGTNWAAAVASNNPGLAVPVAAVLASPIEVAVGEFQAEAVALPGGCNSATSVFGGTWPAPLRTCEVGDASRRIRTGLWELCAASPRVCEAVEGKYRFNLPPKP